MAAIVTLQANQILNMSLCGIGSFTAAVSPCLVRLTSTASAAGAAGTEITGGSGYTTGGTSLGASTNRFATAASGSTTAPSASALSWTNGSTAWSIVSVELWDSAGTPLRWWFGNFNGQPIAVATGNIFQIAVGAITVTLS